jgi:hypothetical protein
MSNRGTYRERSDFFYVKVSESYLAVIFFLTSICKTIRTTQESVELISFPYKNYLKASKTLPYTDIILKKWWKLE